MDLSTHFIFGLALASIFFHRPEIILLVGLGSLIPDLDREYWFMHPEKYLSEEQLHRALFHNFIVMALTYFISPYISLGVFLHCLLDSFTTVKDRGVEWFYPFTRLVKRGLYDCMGNMQRLDPLPRDRVVFYNEDPKELTEEEFAEPKPVPWRRTYGPALNSHILDRTLLLSSFMVFIIWSIYNYLSHQLTTNLIPQYYWLPYLLGYLSIGLLFLSGELTREDGILKNHLTKSKKLLYPIFIAGIICGGLSLGFAWIYWYREYQENFLYPILKDSPYILLSIIVIIISLIAVWRISIKREGIKKERAII